MANYVGIDPGLKGGIAIACDVNDGKAAKWKWEFFAMPIAKTANGRGEVDLTKLVDIIKLYTLDKVTIEYPPKVPGNGVLSTASLFKSYGELRGIVSALAKPVPKMSLPTPQQWKKVILEGTTKDKVAAIDYVCNMLKLDLPKAGPRTDKYHDGIADAVCICIYGYLEDLVKEEIDSDG